MRTSATESGVALACVVTMTIGKLWLVAILYAAIPAVAHAQVNVSVGGGLDANAYDPRAPGDPGRGTRP